MKASNIISFLLGAAVVLFYYKHQIEIQRAMYQDATNTVTNGVINDINILKSMS